MKAEFRHIDRSYASAVTSPPEPGPVPVLEWIPIESLVIDETYQRGIRKDGGHRIRRIAQAFSWTKFAPVIVTPVGDGGWYAIIDGQHRTTAAAACGMERVPCQIIRVDAAGAAAAFAAINGEVTQVTNLEKFRARIAAGDESAIDLRDACAVAGVTICRYPIPADDMKPGETLALGALEAGMKEGRDTLITALQCITETNNNLPGVLRASVIRALVQTMVVSPRWREAGGALLEAFDDIDVFDLYERALRSRLAATRDELVMLLKLALTRKLGAPVEIGMTA